MKIAGRISVFVLLLTISLFSQAIYAEEKIASCPTEFNIDDSAWSMDGLITDTSLERPYTIYTRRFSFFPDVNLYTLIGLKKFWNPDCIVMLTSYGSSGREAEKRVWGFIDSLEGITFYLLTPMLTRNGFEYRWEKGDDLKFFPDCDTTENCYLIFTLYNNGTPVASRVVIIE